MVNKKECVMDGTFLILNLVKAFDREDYIKVV